MLKKSYIFFVIFIVFTISFFIWANQNLRHTNIFGRLEIFTASLISNPTINTAVMAEDPQKAQLDSQDLSTNDNQITPDSKSFTITTISEERIQDLLDDIQEKLDVIQQQVNELLAENQATEKAEGLTENQETDGENEKNEEGLLNEETKIEAPTKEEKSCFGQIDINTAPQQDLEKIIGVGPIIAQRIIEARPFCSLNDLLKVSGIGETTMQKIIEQGCAYVGSSCIGGVIGSRGDSGGGGGGIVVVYPKILISEIQVAGESNDKQEFVELYNPNDLDVDLTNWYLQRKTATGSRWVTYAPKSLFSGRNIPAKGYFLIARTGYYEDLADVFTGNPITDDNAFVLKKPNSEISDRVGFGLALDFESLATTNPGDGQSIGRKFLDSTEQDTDNNSEDFEVQIPTPKAQNIKYVEPPPPEPKDTTPPQVIFNLAPEQNTVEFTVRFTITDLAETTTPSGLASYIFRWQENSGEWHEDSIVEVAGNPESADFTRDFIGEDGKTYNFQVQATDAAGNVSDWIEFSVKIILPKNLLLNEFFDEGWEGTTTQGNPLNWIWGKRGGLELEDPPLVIGKKSFYHEPYFSYYDLTQLEKTLEKGKKYYAEIWAKGTGRIKLGIDHSGITEWLSSTYTDFNNLFWTRLSFSIIVQEETNDGGIRIRMVRLASTGERLVIGAAWLSDSPPPENWPF